jgi:hypothetical protein
LGAFLHLFLPLKTSQTRSYALHAGEFTVPQNFDKPLPEETLKELKEISLMQIMDDIGYQAEKNGLTPEILESILANED